MELLSLSIGFHLLLGLVLGGVVAELVLREDKQHRALTFSLKKLSFVKNSKVSKWGFRELIGVILALVFVLNALFLPVGWSLVYFQALSFLFVAVAIQDLAFRLIPLVYIAALVLLSFFVPMLFDFPLLFSQALLGAMVVGGLVLMLYLITRGRGIGEADVFLAVVIGLLFGWYRGLLVFSVANFLGLLVVLPFVVILGKNRMKQIPLAFFLVLAILLEWYLSYTDWILQAMNLS